MDLRAGGQFPGSLEPSSRCSVPTSCASRRASGRGSRRVSHSSASRESRTLSVTLAIDCVRLAENGVLPKPDICLWKVAKILHFLATFLIHPWTFMTHREPMLATTVWLVKPVYKPHGGSLRVKPAHIHNLTTDQKVVCSNHAGCTPQH